ncbi:hypothetical protein [Deinococcus yunweiensis]|uniref:hypothetical protein n=1 Tax=Deinococcus yunweiensis TaxID=367282 RepID=UPI00398E6AC8
MTDRSDAEPGKNKPPMTFKAIIQNENYLYGVSAEGKEYPLYFFAPLADAYSNIPPYAVPFSQMWPEYTQKFIDRYIPVPSPISVVPAGLTITSQARTGAGGRDWDQVICNGWPLYYVQDDHKKVKKGNHPTMFEPAYFGMPTPGVESPDGVEIPGPSLGP